jgi:hypothetical protein
MLRAYNSEFYIIYYITLAISLCFYPLGIYLYNKKLYWESTYAHSMVHIISNISNLILYSGTILPITNYFEYFNNPVENINTNILDCNTIIDIPIPIPIITNKSSSI